MNFDTEHIDDLTKAFWASGRKANGTKRGQLKRT